MKYMIPSEIASTRKGPVHVALKNGEEKNKNAGEEIHNALVANLLLTINYILERMK